jgi:hypothetical protein
MQLLVPKLRNACTGFTAVQPATCLWFATLVMIRLADKPREVDKVHP